MHTLVRGKGRVRVRVRARAGATVRVRVREPKLKPGPHLAARLRRCHVLAQLAEHDRAG